MKLLEEFKIYENLWGDTSTLLESDGDVASWFKDAGFEGSGKNSYASLQGKNDHRLYVKVGNGSPEEVSFQVDGNRTVIYYQDLLNYYGKVFKLSQAGINLIADNFLKASIKNAITEDEAYKNPFKAFLLILNALSTAKGLIYPMALQADGNLTKTMRPVANSLAALLEQQLQQTNKNLRVDVETVSILCNDHTKLFPLSYNVTLKVSDNKTHDKSTFIDYSRTVKDHKLLNYILFELAGLNADERRKFYNINLVTSLDRPLDDILTFFSKQTKAPEKNDKETSDKEKAKGTSNKEETTENSKKADADEKSEEPTETNSKEEDSKETVSDTDKEKENMLADYKKNLDDMNDFLLNSFSEDQNKALITRAYKVIARALEIMQQYKKGQY